MTITNFTATLNGPTVTCKWDSDQPYSFVYVDAEMVNARPLGVTEYTTSFVEGAVYQAVDSATASPIPAALEPMPPRYLTIFWDESTEPDVAKYEINLNGAPVQYQNAGNPNYTYRTPRLESGENSIVVIAIDKVGNALGDVSELTYEIESVPPPVEGVALSQSAATNLTVTIVPPAGW